MFIVRSLTSLQDELPSSSGYREKTPQTAQLHRRGSGSIGYNLAPSGPGGARGAAVSYQRNRFFLQELFKGARLVRVFFPALRGSPADRRDLPDLLQFGAGA